jgi:hypothetical protein
MIAADGGQELILTAAGCRSAAAAVALLLAGEPELATTVTREAIAGGDAEAVAGCLLYALTHAIGANADQWRRSAQRAAAAYSDLLAREAVAQP